MSWLSIILFLTLIVTALGLLLMMHRYKKLNTVHQHLQTLINSIPDLTWVKDKDSRFLLVNEQFSKAFSKPIDEILGKTDFDISADPMQAQGYYEDDLKTQKARKILYSEERITDGDGKAGWAETIKIPIFDDNNNVVGTAGMARNISKRKLVEQQMAYLAYHDELTGLANRSGFTQQFTKLLNLNNCAVAMILFDLDNFKTINDSLGHSSGDQALIQLAERFKTLLDENTIVARLSGDEFVIAHNYAKLENSLTKLQAKLLQQFDAPIQLNNINYTINASFGVAVAPQDGRDFETLLQHADLAMYQSKATPNKYCVYFKQEFADSGLHAMQLSNQLDQAIKKQQLSLHYQPKIDAETNKLIGMEGLLRWQNDDSQFISPYDFIPIAEKNGFIIELGKWVINEALQQIRYWLDNNIAVVPVSINISTIQLRQPEFLEYLMAQLNFHCITGNLLEIEITESVLMDDVQATVSVLKKIQAMGVLISIDDFGTGYSALSYLPMLPINTLKIDRSFISNLHLNVNNQKIIQAIVQLSKNFNLSVIAEGIESINELIETRNCGINHIQGYYYSHPLTSTDLEKDWLAQHSTTNLAVS